MCHGKQATMYVSGLEYTTCRNIVNTETTGQLLHQEKDSRYPGWVAVAFEQAAGFCAWQVKISDGSAPCIRKVIRS